MNALPTAVRKKVRSASAGNGVVCVLIFQMKPRVYIETSVVSYLTARSNRDLIVAAHQQITTELWARRDAFEFYSSELRPVGATRMQLLNG